MTLSFVVVRDIVMLVMLIRSPVAAHMNCEDILIVGVIPRSHTGRTGRYCASRRLDWFTCTTTVSFTTYALVVSVTARRLAAHSSSPSSVVHIAIWLSSTIKPPPGFGKNSYTISASHPFAPFISRAYSSPALRSSSSAAKRSSSLANMYTLYFMSYGSGAFSTATPDEYRNVPSSPCSAHDVSAPPKTGACVQTC